MSKNKNVLGIIIALFGVVAMVGVGFGVYRVLFGGLATNADYFFEQFAEGNYEAAYDSTASDFKTVATYEHFVYLAEAWELDTVVDTKWPSRGFENQYGYLQGTVEHEDGTTTAVYVELLKEDSEWKVVSVLFGEAAMNPQGYLQDVANGVEEVPEGLEIEGIEDLLEGETVEETSEETVVEEGESTEE